MQQSFGVSLSDVDLFYHFQVELANNILRFFAEFAKNGALLAFAPTMGDAENLPKSIQYLESSLNMRFYRKG